jgi:hypothetical protein
MGAKRGDWIQTATGRPFWPIDPRPADIDIEDIAHALSMLCRFGGHCLRFYSVAEHSVLLSRHVAPEHKLWALLHDASEAYLVDVPRPLKPFLRGYREAEDKIMRAVCERYRLPPEMPEAVKAADTSLLMDEAAQNMSRPHIEWELKASPLGVTLEYLEPSEAREAFLCAFEELGN